MLAKEIVYIFAQTGGRDLNTTQVESISTFGFLYGTLPTAPPVVLYATKYNLDVDMVSKPIGVDDLIFSSLQIAKMRFTLVGNTALIFDSFNTGDRLRNRQTIMLKMAGKGRSNILADFATIFCKLELNKR